jgi:hypothetical protein
MFLCTKKTELNIHIFFLQLAYNWNPYDNLIVFRVNGLIILGPIVG